ncbi:tetratricopeptide repeat protein [Azospirillum sp. INR13]|uniref:tetratricopeptide repeat protein n=1 Tax=Azospirillum sp. INR13 TaxID=2596919 RepID=UPI0018922E61|nr:tetratricopeptide repeat protein [Azospirillum sp. INR13]MBF5093496.1 tetratricopeptide repeat protein [Azospirillum sp. INR13]
MANGLGMPRRVSRRRASDKISDIPDVLSAFDELQGGPQGGDRMPAVCFGAFDTLSIDHMRTLDEIAVRHGAVAVALIRTDRNPDGFAGGHDDRAVRVAALQAVDFVVTTDAVAGNWSTVASRLFGGSKARIFGIDLAVPNTAPQPEASASLPRKAPSPPTPSPQVHAEAAALHRRAFQAVERGEFGEAVQHMGAALRLLPLEPAFHQDLARIAFHAGRPALTAVSACSGLALVPANESLHHLRGLALMADGMFEDALSCLERATLLRPEVATFHIDLANALRSAGRLDEAVSRARHAVRLAPEDRAAHHALGLCLGRRGDHAEAAECFATTVRLDPAGDGLHHFMEATYLDAMATGGETEGSGAPWRHNDARVVRRTVGGVLAVCCFDLITRSRTDAESDGTRDIDGTVLAGHLTAAAAQLQDDPAWQGAAPLLQAFAAALRDDVGKAASHFESWLRTDDTCHVRILGPFPASRERDEAPQAGPEQSGPGDSRQDVTHIELSVEDATFPLRERVVMLLQLVERLLPSACPARAGTAGNPSLALCRSVLVALDRRCDRMGRPSWIALPLDALQSQLPPAKPHKSPRDASRKLAHA